MFTHEQTLQAINAGLTALGEKPLPGIPVAAPGHSDACVLGCSYAKYGGSLSSGGLSGTIDFDRARDAELVSEAWQQAGVDCHVQHGNTIRFTGGLKDWMDAFDGGEWEQLIVPTFDRNLLRWDSDDEQPGDETVPVDELPPVGAEA